MTISFNNSRVVAQSLRDTYMNMKAAKVLRKFLLLIGTNVLKVLIAKNNDTTFCYQ